MKVTKGTLTRIIREEIKKHLLKDDALIPRSKLSRMGTGSLIPDVEVEDEPWEEDEIIALASIYDSLKRRHRR